MEEVGVGAMCADHYAEVLGDPGKAAISLPSDTTEISSDQTLLLGRIQSLARRIEAAQAAMTPPGMSRGPEAEMPAPVNRNSPGGAFDRDVAEAMESARVHSPVGADVPPLTTFKGWKHGLALAAARALLRVAQPITREQRAYNVAMLNALQLLHETSDRTIRGTLEAALAARDGVVTAVGNRLTNLEQVILGTDALDGETGGPAGTASAETVMGRLEHAESETSRSQASLSAIGEDVRQLRDAVEQHSTDLGSLREDFGQVGQLSVRIDQQQAVLDQLVARAAAQASALERQAVSLADLIVQNETAAAERATDYPTMAAKVKDIQIQDGLWLNDPIQLAAAGDGQLSLDWITERIVEQPFILQAVGSLSGRRIIDLGACESIVPVNLANLGIDLTCVDLRAFRFVHPNLHFVRADLRSLPFSDRSFDVAYALSTVEHVGLGHYGDPVDVEGDRCAVCEACRVLEIGGTFFVTIPMGRPAITPVHRIYGVPEAQQLLRGFQIEAMQLFSAHPIGGTCYWLPCSESDIAGIDSFARVQAVGLFRCRRMS